MVVSELFGVAPRKTNGEEAPGVQIGNFSAKVEEAEADARSSRLPADRSFTQEWLLRS